MRTTASSFWFHLDRLVSECKLVIDRPAGSRHPRYPEVQYPLDYGYLQGSHAGEGDGAPEMRVICYACYNAPERVAVCPTTAGAHGFAKNGVKGMEDSKALADLTSGEIQDAVKTTYGRVAEEPCGAFPFPVGRKFAESVGYPAEVLDRLPPGLAESFTGAGNPQDFVDARAGETLLDLGCGVGLDLYFYAQKVGSTGQLYGLDFSPAMIASARANLSAAGVANVTLLAASAEAIPLPDASVDLVTSNGIYNLCPGKVSVMREVFRVLRPGGRTIFSEIVLREPMGDEVRKQLRDWFRCIGGALPREDFLRAMEETGFVGITVLDLRRNARTGHELAICATIRAEKPAGG